jgi:hypothetical protein
MRQDFSGRLKAQGICPSFNLNSCEWFEKFDKENKTVGKYGTNGGEHYIEELGYWVDYINFEKKLIIEWDETTHYYHDQLKEKDKIRQIEIEKIYPDFKFVRIRTDRYGKIINI